MVLIIKVGRIVLNLIYGFMKLLPVQEKVALISRQSNKPSIEFQMICSEIDRRGKNVKTVLLCKTLDGGVDSSLFNKMVYALHMMKQMYHLATSKVVILDSYCILASVLCHKKELKIIQIWHSMGTMKKFGYTALDTQEGSSSKLAYAMKMHQNYDYVFASSDAYKEHLASGFNCDINKIITMPLPRLDLLQSEEYADTMKRKIYEKYPMLKEKPVILYCPTFRKDETEFEKAVYELSNSIDYDKYSLVVKLHPLSKIKLQEQIIKAEGFSSSDMFFVADYVISDYSCIVYEAAVLNIPLYFYNFDMDFYTYGRGLAIDYENELPGVISRKADRIVKAIENEIYDLDELKRFAEKYVRPTKHATKDIVDFVMKFI